MRKDWKDLVVCPWCSATYSNSEFTLHSASKQIKKCEECSNKFSVKLTNKVVCKTEKTL